MDSKTSGIVRLEDLPGSKVFVCLEDELFNEFNQKIRDYGIYSLAKELKVSKRMIIHWLSDGSLIRLDVLMKIADYFKISFKEKISFLRGKKGGRMFNPKLPFNFNSSEGVRIVGGILGDGGIPTKRLNPNYSNTNPGLIDGFIQDVWFVCGRLEFSKGRSIKEHSVIEILNFPTLFCDLLKVVGLKNGKKVELNQGIPEFILKSEDSAKYAFLAQFIDDEGTISFASKHISLSAACLERFGKPKIFTDLEILLSSLDILVSIYPGKVYPSSRGEDRRNWCMQIDGQIQLRKIYENSLLRHSEKREKLDSILKSYKLNMFRRRDLVKTYQSHMSRIQDSKGYFTSKDLAESTGRDVGSCRNTLLKFKKLKVVRCVKPYTSGEYHEWARYVVENEIHF
ncbi:MAG: hypothetical protein WC595_01895 [Candidatus Nanoarchaeia archaeon]